MKRSTMIAGLAGLAVFLVICCALVVEGAVVLQVSGINLLGGGGSQMVLASPSRGGNVDLRLLRLGREVAEGTVLAEDARPGAAALGLWREGQFEPFGSLWFGGFIPGTEDVLFQYEQGGETLVNWMAAGQDEPRLVLESDAGLLTAFPIRGGRALFIREESSGGLVRCYLSRGGGEAERVARGQDCQLSSDGSTVVYAEVSGDETTLTAVDVDGSSEVVLLDGERGVLSFRVSADGSRVAYLVSPDYGEAQVIVVSCRDGQLIAEGEQLGTVIEYDFAPEGEELYYVGAERGEEVLYTLGRENTEVASGLSVTARFTPRGTYLVYLVSEGMDEEALSVRPMQRGEDVEILRGASLAFALVDSPERLVITEYDGDDFTLYSVAFDGGELVELYEDSGIVGFNALILAGEPMVYLVLVDQDGRQSLIVTSHDRPDGRVLLEDWYEVRLLNRSANGRWTVVVGREDYTDNPAMYSIEVTDGADPRELDDSFEGVVNAVFTASGNEILYGVVTGPNEDDVEVRRVGVEGEERSATLYDEALLVAVEWDRMEPFTYALLPFWSFQTRWGW